MHKFRLLYFFVAALCVVSFTSCSDDDDAEPSQQALLTAGEWEGARIYLDNQDYTEYFRDSVDFDIREFSYRFDDNGEYRQTYGRTVLGTWEISDIDEELIVLDRGETYESRLTINRLTDTELHLESTAWFGPQAPPLEFRFTRP